MKQLQLIVVNVITLLDIKRFIHVGLDTFNYTCLACKTKSKSDIFINCKNTIKQERLTNVGGKCYHQSISRKFLRYHKENEHSSKDVLYVCNQCDYGFTSRKVLSRQKSIKNAHGAEALWEQYFL